MNTSGILKILVATQGKFTSYEEVVQGWKWGCTDQSQGFGRESCYLWGAPWAGGVPGTGDDSFSPVGPERTSERLHVGNPKDTPDAILGGSSDAQGHRFSGEMGIIITT